MSAAEALAAALGCARPGCACARPGANGRVTTHCPGHRDERPSLSVAARGGKLLVRCFAGCAQADVLAALRERGLWPARPTPAAAPPSATWRICDRDGRLVAVHERHDGPDGKRFVWRRPDGRPGLGGLSPRALLYGAERLAALAAGAPVLVVEGEKSADAARALGAEAVATVCGAASVPDDAVLKPLARLDPVLWPDADLPGERHMQRLAARLAALGGRPRWLTWPAAPPGGDAADFLASGGTAAALQALIAAAVPWAPPADAEPAAEPAEAGATPVLRCLADVQPEPVRWLWPGRVPLGKLTILDGDPGLGKSLLTLDLAARISVGGPLPDSSRSDLDGPAGVVLLSAEDGLADTIRPRLEAAGADLGRVYALPAVRRDDGEEAAVTLLDLDELEAAITQTGAALVVIDPLMAYMPGSANSWRDQDVRRLLAPLAALAERTGAAVVLVRHLNKRDGGNPIYRGGGSIGLIGAARSGLLVAKDPDDPSGRRRVLAVTKCNLAAEPLSLAYRLEPTPGGTVRIAWLGETEHTARSVLASQTETDEDRSALIDAEAFLRDLLANGPVAADEVLKAARQAGVSERTLRRAKAALRIVSRKQALAGGWAWELPPEGCQPSPKADEDCQAQMLGNLRPSWQPSWTADEDCQDCQAKMLGNLRATWQPSQRAAPAAPGEGCQPSLTGGGAEANADEEECEV